MSDDKAEREPIKREPVPLPCTKSKKCFYTPNEVFVGGSRNHTCEHGDVFIIAANKPRAIVYSTRNVTPKKETTE